MPWRCHEHLHIDISGAYLGQKLFKSIGFKHRGTQISTQFTDQLAKLLV